MDNEEKNLVGIRGWLILVAIGIILGLISLIMSSMLMIATYHMIFSRSVWEALTTQGSDVYSPLVATIIIIKALIHSGMLLAYLYMVYLFFSKKMVFPKWCIGLAVFSLAFIIADGLAIKLVFSSQAVFNRYTADEFIGALFIVIIVVPYMLISKRVKATFVN